MKKSYRYRYKRIYPKQKWAINTIQNDFSVGVASSNNFSISGSTLIENPSRNNTSGQSVNSASSILKCAHIKVKGVITSGMLASQSILISLMYCPEGITPFLNNASLDTIGSTIFYSHPEWIIAWTRMDYSNAAQKNEFYLTSRLKRNLNPGDTIRLIVYNTFTGDSATTAIVKINATSSYCCRAN